MKRSLLWILCAALAGCATQAPEPLVLEDTSWMMRLPTKSHCDVAPMLEFSGGKVTGDLGCNRLKADYKLEGARLTFRNVTLTRRLCSGEVMQHEAAMRRVIEETYQIQTVGKDLRFLTQDGKEILTLTPETLGACR